MKGPSAAIYGFNAYDGVVNIVTKTPHEMKGNTKGTFVQFGGGELGTIRSTAIQAGTHGDFGYRLSFGHDQNQKWSDRNSLALRSNKFNLLTDYTLNDGAKVSLSGGLVSSNRYDGQVFDAIHELSQISNGYVAAAYERPNFFIRTSWTRWQRSSLELLLLRCSTALQLSPVPMEASINGSTTMCTRHGSNMPWMSRQPIG